MTIEEIFQKLATHMVEGVMLHDDLANYYDFLGLRGYKRCHEYHCMHEMKGYRCLCRYFINHHDKLIPEGKTDYESIIPSSWYDRVRHDVDENTKRRAVKTAVEKWVQWEAQTKQLYQEMYNRLIELGEVGSAGKINAYVCDVNLELKKAKRHWLNLEIVDYDMVYMLSEQTYLHDKYKEKL